MINVSYITDVLYGGVDFSLPGNGGWECVEFLTSKQRVIETVVYETFTLFVFWKMLGHVSIPRELPAYREGTGVAKRLLLVLLCLIFGIEIGFKFATKQVIFLLNPCHVVTAIQVSLISIFFSKLSMGFNLHLRSLKRTFDRSTNDRATRVSIENHLLAVILEWANIAF